MRRVVLAIWCHKCNHSPAKSVSNSTQWFCFPINFANCKTFRIVSWPAYICTCFPPNVFRFTTTLHLLLSPHSFCTKSEEVWLRSKIASGPCSHQVWASQLWMSDWIHLQSTYFCHFKGSQTGRILRLLAFVFSDIWFSLLSSSDFLPELGFYSYELVSKHF